MPIMPTIPVLQTVPLETVLLDLRTKTVDPKVKAESRHVRYVCPLGKNEELGKAISKNWSCHSFQNFLSFATGSRVSVSELR